MNRISEAVEILRGGGLVAFPTETVYGLGADATNAAAVRRVFDAKGRPGTNPLIVHVADESVARRYAGIWPQAASQLAQAFWPGPLTIVVTKNPVIVDEATAGLPTAGLRSPDHPLTLELLQNFDGPLVGPSANRSTHVSPTTAEHVRREVGDAVDLVLDGGPCRVGIESTVLDLSRERPVILRPGAITREQIERVIGQRVWTFEGSVDETTPAISPGQQAVHYAPRTPAFRFERVPPVSAIGERQAFILVGKTDELRRVSTMRIEMPRTPQKYAQHLYAILRELDESGAEAIWVEMPPSTSDWTAVRDRLTRATRPALA